MADTYELRLTLRACDDLSVSSDTPLSDLIESHQLIKKLVELRSQTVEGQEAIQLPRSTKPVWSLHAGRWRGLTWWDADTAVVWLPGAGYHESGSAGDAYRILKERDAVGELFPTPQDYLGLEPDPATTEQFVAALAKEGPPFVDDAIKDFGIEKRHVFADILEIRVVSNSDGLWIGILLPPFASGVLPDDFYMAVLGALLRTAEPDELLHGPSPFPGSPHDGYELVILWRGAPRVPSDQ